MRATFLVPVLTIALAAPALAQERRLSFDDSKDTKAEDEAFLQKLLEIIEKTVAAAENQALDKTPYGALAPKDHEAAEEITRRLDNQRISLNFEDVTLAEALDYFREITGLNIVETRKCKDLVEGGPKLKLKLKDVKVRNALELTLSQTDAQIRYGIRHGVLEIGTVEDWKGKELILEVIPLDELVYHPPDFPAPEAGLAALRPKFGNKAR